jgi:predicted LPLAT superfamily acyltransferase
MADTIKEGDSSEKWTSRSVGSRFQHNFFYFIIKYGGRRSAYAILSFIVLFYVLCRPSIRRKADYYLFRRFKRKFTAQRLLDNYKIYLNLGKSLIDRAVVGILGEEKITVEFREKERLHNLVKEGKGIILMTSHVGCWQTAMSSLRFLQRQVHLLLLREEGDIDRHYFEHSGAAAPYRIIDPTGYLGGILEMMQALRSGEIVCVMGDRLFGGQKGSLPVEFLGGKTLFPISAFKIASATGAPIASLYSYKSGPDSYALEIYNIIRVPSEVGKSDQSFNPYVREFAKTLERFITAHPYQFFNFYDMWIEDSQTIK